MGETVTGILPSLGGSVHGGTRLVALLLYGSGMRLMECLTLRVKDIDIARCEILIRRGKGAKDRVTVLPGILRPAMASQIAAVTIAVRHSGITKRATCHTFRRSFATHLLESGTEIRTVQ